MKINFNMEKKHILTLVIVICIISSIGYLVATPATPGVSHPWDEIDKPSDCPSGEYVYGTDGTGWMCSRPSGGGSGVYVGATTLGYNGAQVGGYTGGNDKCNNEYPGSRMCYAGDFVNGRPGDSGWYNSFGKLRDTDNSGDCGGWTQGTNSYAGPIWSGRPRGTICSGEWRILCCQ